MSHANARLTVHGRCLLVPTRRRTETGHARRGRHGERILEASGVTMTEQSLYERLGGVNAIAMVLTASATRSSRIRNSM